MQSVSTGLKSKTPMGAMMPTGTMMAYVMFLSSAWLVYYFVANGEFSAILTISVMLQCMSFALLGVQVLLTGKSNGISARALTLDAFALCFRLSSTLWLNGYLPVDASGDYIFQAFDLTSVVLVALLLQKILKDRSEEDTAQDSFPVFPVIVGSILLGALLHADMNVRPIFDTLWMAGLFISSLAVMPQLWLIYKTGGKAEALTAHYIAAMAASRALSGVFMWYAREDLTCVPLFGSFNHAVPAILGAHAVQILLLGDFGYAYVKAVMHKGLASSVELIQDCNV
eukprot:TRINITY_DN44275_c0_g1_i1.p1 TRINITY_DN44275_c0_g1~~TRINITY_DN44275_c0_g1_i1.p1  ORF type:complete len:305 (+),score=53.26 TRINITY_DN44275_c0_g1_i1:66-917(+)